MRGEFVRGDGLVLPNNITTYGVQTILGAALRGESTTLFLALANCAPQVDLQLEGLNEPTIGEGGYERQPVNQNDTDWEVLADTSGEVYFETRDYVFVPTDEGFDKPIVRPVLVNTELGIEGEQVVAVGSALPAEMILTPDTPIELRTFKYRIYGR